MFDLKEEDVVGLTNKLLYNIWKSLNALQGIEKKLPIGEVEKEQAKPVAGEIEAKETKSCKYCGEVFDNKGKLLAHYRNCPKKE